MQRTILHDPIYDTDILIQHGGTLKSAVAHYCKKVDVALWDIEENECRIGHTFAHEPYRTCGIWFREGATAGIIAHECFHATYHILSNVGLILSGESEESFAYYLQWLTAEVTKFTSSRS
jgi:hypothetical protein